MKTDPSHLLGIQGLPVGAGSAIFAQAKKYKQNRGQDGEQVLKGQTWALIFSKSSTRTRVSFEVGIAEMGGRPLFLNANDIQLGRGEPIKDTARVLGRMVHGAVIRTYAQKDVDDFAHYSKISTVNALTDDEHPCQALTDVFTFEEKRGPILGKKIAFVGDAACNMAISLAYSAAYFGFELWLAAPNGYECPVKNSHVFQTNSPEEAARNADAVYTDVWISMGKEEETAKRIKDFDGYQLNHDLMKGARPGALVLHCLPAYRGKEISEELLESHADDIFEQAENRLHVQKGILHWLVHSKTKA